MARRDDRRAGARAGGGGRRATDDGASVGQGSEGARTAEPPEARGGVTVKGSVYKRCPCPVEYDSRGRRKACKRKHGSWYYVADLGPGPGGRRRQERRGGYATQD